MITVNQVTAGYENNPVLHDITFSLRPGESLGIIGPNGCGKTTLLKAIANIIPYNGEVLIDGKPVKKMKRKELAKKLAMLSQITQIYFSYSVYDTVMMGRYVHSDGLFISRPSAHDHLAVEQALKMVGMYELRDRETDALSGGQLQRVFLAKTLVQEPDIILLDEPTNHLDLSYQLELLLFLKEWSIKHNKTIIGVLHDINLAMLLTDRIMLMDEGKIKALGTDILSSPVLNEVYKMDIRAAMLSMLEKWKPSDA